TEEFDAVGRRRKMTDAAGTTHYDHDEWGRLSGVRRDGAAPLTYAYDSQGRVNSVKVGDGFEIGYRYDFLGRPAEIRTPVGTFSTQYSRDSDGLPMTVHRYPSGVRSERRRNKEGRPASLAHYAADGQLLARFSYDYRPDGLISRVTEEWPDEKVLLTYQYDNVQRLASVVDSKHGTISYHYDLVGNRTELLAAGQAPVASRFDWAGRLVETGGASCA